MPTNTALVFSNAAFRAIDGKTGFGFAIWLYGSWVCIRSVDGSKVFSPKEAEAQAIFTALNEASLQGHSKIHLLSDA